MFMWEKCRTVELYTVYSIQYTRYRAPPVCSAWPRMKEGTEPGAAPSKAEEKVSVLRAVNRTSRNFTMLALLEAPTSSAFCFHTYQETVDYKPEQAKAPLALAPSGGSPVLASRIFQQREGSRKGLLFALWNCEVPLAALVLLLLLSHLTLNTHSTFYYPEHLFECVIKWAGDLS